MAFIKVWLFELKMCTFGTLSTSQGPEEPIPSQDELLCCKIILFWSIIGKSKHDKVQPRILWSSEVHTYVKSALVLLIYIIPERQRVMQMARNLGCLLCSCC